VVPFPLYYQLGNESLYSVSQRFPDVVRRVDPALLQASIQGFNSLWKVATYTGMVIAALGCQITEGEHLLSYTDEWLPAIQRATYRNPDLAPSLEFFREYARLTPAMRTSRTQSLLTKIAPFSLDPTLRALHGSFVPGKIDVEAG